MFKYVAVAAFTGTVTALNLQDASQELVELNEMENEAVDTGLEELEQWKPATKTAVQ